MLVVARWGAISELQHVRRITRVWWHPPAHLILSRKSTDLVCDGVLSFLSSVEVRVLFRRPHLKVEDSAPLGELEHFESQRHEISEARPSEEPEQCKCEVLHPPHVLNTRSIRFTPHGFL